MTLRNKVNNLTGRNQQHCFPAEPLLLFRTAAVAVRDDGRGVWDGGGVE